MKFQVIYTFNYNGGPRECELFTGSFDECENYITEAKDYLDIK